MSNGSNWGLLVWATEQTGDYWYELRNKLGIIGMSYGKNWDFWYELRNKLRIIGMSYGKNWGLLVWATEQTEDYWYELRNKLRIIGMRYGTNWRLMTLVKLNWTAMNFVQFICSLCSLQLALCTLHTLTETKNISLTIKKGSAF